MNRKVGKIRSVGVQPCQYACPNGTKMCPQSPGLLTKIIAPTVMPRIESTETKRCAPGCNGSMA
jgi:hypothetical protein